MKNLKKILLTLGVVLAVIIVLLAGAVVVFVRSFEPNTFKPQIIAQAKEMLGRDVGLGNLSLSLSLRHGLFLSAADIVIGEDPSFSSGHFLSIKRLGLGLDPLSLITRREINVSSLEITAPKVSLVRNDEGVFNFQTLKVLKQNSPGSPSQGAAASSAAVIALLVQNIIVQDGALDFKDYFEEEKALELKKLDARVTDFSLIRPFRVALKAAVFSDEQNLDLNGSGSLDIRKASLILSNVRSTFDLKSVDVRRLASVLPALAQAKLQNPLGGMINLVIDDAVVNAQGLLIKKMHGQISNGVVKTGYLAAPAKNIEGRIVIDNGTLAIEPASCVLGGGRVELSAKVANYLTSQEYVLGIKTGDLNVAEILPQAGQDVVLEGLASLEANVQGKGLADLASSAPRSGKALLRFKDGWLRNINILRLVLDKMSMLPDLVEKLEQSLPENYKKKLQQNDTEIKSVNFDMNVVDGQLAIDPAQVQTDVFALQGKGTMDLRMNAQMEMQIVIPQDLSKSMAASVQELKFLEDKDGQIVIPLWIQGKVPDKLTYLPDLEYLGRQLFESKGREQLGNLLDKVLKTKDGSGEAGTEGQSGSSEGNSSPGQVIVNSVLDAIFKK